jgi:hypothetical protein
MYRMLKWFGVGIAIVSLYMMAIYIQAYRGERRAEKHVAFVLKEITSPWDMEKMRYYGSDLFNKKGAERFAPAVQEILGSFRKVIKNPKCNFISGFIQENPGEKLIFAECITTIQFEKGWIEFNVRFVEEPSLPPTFFRVLGDNLKLNDFIELKLNVGEAK